MPVLINYYIQMAIIVPKLKLRTIFAMIILELLTN